MLKFLYSATKVAGLTYQLLATSVLIGVLVVGVSKQISQKQLTD